MLESNKKQEVDYLVVGAGATSMAFVDEIISITNDVSIIVVEKRGKAGGHWNDTYPFATLQHPAAWYGVNSRILGSGGQDMVSKSKITAYYEDVVNDLSATGRVKFYWQCESFPQLQQPFRVFTTYVCFVPTLGHWCYD